jgi:hypothetical protein
MHLLDIKGFGKMDEIPESAGLPLTGNEYLCQKLEGAKR